MNIKKLFLLIAGGLLFSCSDGYVDVGSKIRYSVINKTSSDLHLDINPPSGVGLGGSYDLEPNEEIIIFASEDMGTASHIIERKPMNLDFLKCLVLTKDSILLKLDPQNNSSWTSKSIGDTLALYQLVITSDATK